MEKGIKINIDYGDGVVKINKLKIAFEDLGTTAQSVSRSIAGALGGDKTNFARSEKRMRRQIAALKEVQSSLSTTNKQYRIYQAEIDKVQARLDKLTDLRKKEEIAVKGSAAAIRKEIEALKMAQENRTKSNIGYRKAQEEIQRLTDLLEQMTDTREEHEIVQEGSIASIEKEISRYKSLQRNVAITSEKVEEYQKDIDRLENKKHALAGTTGNLARANDSYSSSAGIAGSTATEFGRILADMPYGLQGVANNIEQFTQQFVDLQRKSGGFTEALNSLKTTIMGPAGIVVAVQAASMIFQIFQKQMDKSKESVEELDSALLNSTARLERIVDRFADVNLSEEKRAELIELSGAFTEKETDLIAKKFLNEKEIFDLLNMKAALQNNEIQRAEDLEEKETKLAELKSLNAKIDADREGMAKRLLKATNDAIRLNNQGSANRQKTITLADAENKIQQMYLERQEKINALIGEQEVIGSKQLTTQKAIDAILAEGEKRRKKAEEEDKGKEDDPKKPGTIAYFEEIIGKLQEQQEEVATTSEAYDEIAKQIVAYEDKIENITKEKEKERQQELKELKLDYSQEILEETQKDELQKLFIQEEAAKQEALKLGATKDDLLLIEEAYQIRRGKIVDKYQKEDDKKLDDAKKAAVSSIKEKYKAEVDAMKMAMEQLSSVLTNFGAVLDELGQMSQHRYERQINNINSEKELVKQNENLSIQEKESALTFLQQRENEVQKKRIKAERDMFTIKQTIMLSEMILKQRMMVQEQILLAKQNVLIAKVNGERTMQGVAITAAEQVGKAGMSIGEFMRQLGPWGIAAFALSIGGVIASIISARKKAQAEIAGLSNAPVKLGRGGGSTGSSPIFNVVGATSQNQLAETISDAQSRPVRAYVVSNEVTTAQGLERNILEGASI